MSTFLITGASRGIGAEIAREAHSLGHNVVINYKNSRESAENLAKSLGERATAIKADVSVKDEVDTMFGKAEDLFGGVDVLVNNAGVSSFGVIQDISEAEWDRVFDTNVKGAFLCTKAALGHMIRNHGGVIVNISSMWGLVGASCEVHYSASKAALIGMTKALAKELGPSGIRVNCVAPGVIDTDMNRMLTAETVAELCEETPLGKIGEPSDVAAAVMFLASDGGKFITGQIISPNGGIVI